MASPDASALRSAALRVGWWVAGVCAVMVLGGGLLFFAYLWFKTHLDAPNPAEHHLTVALDPGDLAVAGLVLGVLAVLVAGLVAVLVARRSVRPLAEALARQRGFVADAGHELRTPLAVLHARVQQLQMLTPQDDARRPVVDGLAQDSRVLVDLVDDLLASAEGVADPHAVTGLAPALSRLEDDLGLMAQQRGVVLRTNGPDVNVAVSAPALHRCLMALTDNAIAHTPPGRGVTITASASGRTAVVEVRDEGSGIQGIDPSRIFERFAHGAAGTDADGTERTGHGIGLALVSDVAARHGGAVSLVSTGPDGTVFRLSLPLAPTPTQPPAGSQP